MRHLRIGAASIGRRVRLLIEHDDVLDSAAVLAKCGIAPMGDYQAKKKGSGENRGPSS